MFLGGRWLYRTHPISDTVGFSALKAGRFDEIAIRPFFLE
jgi:hypothetical protein